MLLPSVCRHVSSIQWNVCPTGVPCRSAPGFVPYSHLSHFAGGGVGKVPFSLTLMGKEVDCLFIVDKPFGGLLIPDEAMYSSFKLLAIFSVICRISWDVSPLLVMYLANTLFCSGDKL